MELSIVIPVYNSAGILETLCGRITLALSSYNFEVILVNDSSTDNSWKVIEKIAGNSDRFKGICFRKNAGQDNAILAGIRESSGNYVVIMDDDLQHYPEDIIKLYVACKQGYDVCYATFKQKKQNFLKNAGSRFNGLLARWLLKKPRGLYLSPFKVITKALACEIASFTGPYPYIDGIILSLTSNITQTKVDHHQRFEGKGNYSLEKSASVMFKLFTGFSVAPLRLATFTGMFFSIIGFILIVFYLYEFFISKNYIEGWTTIVILIIFFGGLGIMFLGLIGEYIARIFLAVNNKPQYSILKKTHINHSGS